MTKYLAYPVCFLGAVIFTKSLEIRDRLLQAHAEKPFLLEYEVDQTDSFKASESWSTQFVRDNGWKSKELHDEPDKCVFR